MENQEKLSDDDQVIFIPSEHIRIIERVFRNWELVKQEYRHVEAGKDKDKSSLID
jgi:hypothetical protein